MRVQTAATTSVMVDSISSATKAMGAVNKQMDPAKMQKTLNDFQMANMQMDVTEEMMDDALIDAFDMDDEMEAEENAIVSQVLAEAGMVRTQIKIKMRP
jgi:charged multivesicular body protein 2B